MGDIAPLTTAELWSDYQEAVGLNRRMGAYFYGGRGETNAYVEHQ